MIANQTENAFGVTGVTSRAATSPLSGRVHVAVTPLRARAELCLQAASEQVFVAAAASAAAPMGLGIDVRGDWAATTDAFAPDAIAPITHLGFDKQYGNTPHHSGTRVWKPPV